MQSVLNKKRAINFVDAPVDWEPFDLLAAEDALNRGLLGIDLDSSARHFDDFGAFPNPEPNITRSSNSNLNRHREFCSRESCLLNPNDVVSS